MTRWRYECPEGCGYCIDVAMDSGTGEKAARIMDAHLEDCHAAAVSP